MAPPRPHLPLRSVRCTIPRLARKLLRARLRLPHPVLAHRRPAMASGHVLSTLDRSRELYGRRTPLRLLSATLLDARSSSRHAPPLGRRAHRFYPHRSHSLRVQHEQARPRMAPPQRRRSRRLRLHPQSLRPLRRLRTNRLRRTRRRSLAPAHHPLRAPQPEKCGCPTACPELAEGSRFWGVGSSQRITHPSHPNHRRNLAHQRPRSRHSLLRPRRNNHLDIDRARAMATHTQLRDQSHPWPRTSHPSTSSPPPINAAGWTSLAPSVPVCASKTASSSVTPENPFTIRSSTPRR